MSNKEARIASDQPEQHTSWSIDLHSMCIERGHCFFYVFCLCLFQSLPFRIQPFSDISRNSHLLVCFQGVKKEYTRKKFVFVWNLIGVVNNLIQNSTRIHDDTQRPMPALIDGNEDEFLGENIDILPLGP